MTEKTGTTCTKRTTEIILQHYTTSQPLKQNKTKTKTKDKLTDNPEHEQNDPQSKGGEKTLIVPHQN